MTESTISSVEMNLVLPLFGARDQHLRRLREQFQVAITHRNGQIKVVGEDADAVQQATLAIEQLTQIVRRRGNLTPDAFDQTIARVTGVAAPVPAGTIDVLDVARQIRPKTKGQAHYVKAIRDHDLVFSIGPAGTGKTYLAVAMAVQALKHKDVRKIVLVRPAVEAGESLGFLPGDLQAKINPYLRPLLDAIHEMVGYDQVQQLIERNIVEVLPLAYMRGRTLNESFIILDEAQNTTISQMKMFLTRMGQSSKIVVSGDPTQLDLPLGTESGLTDAIHRLKNIEGVKVTELTGADIVRHRLVQDIVVAYETTKPASKPASKKGRNGTRSSTPSPDPTEE